MDDEWIVDPRDQERIWDIATALLSRSPAEGGPPGPLERALQQAAAEFFAARKALRRGVKFYVVQDGQQKLRQVRSLENGTWVQEKAKKKPSSQHTGG